MPQITKQQKEACDTAQEALKGNPGVVSVGVGYRYRNGKRTDEVCIVVGVKKRRFRRSRFRPGKWFRNL